MHGRTKKDARPAGQIFGEAELLRRQDDETRLFRMYKAWRREQIDAALAGPHGTDVTALRVLLRRLAPDSRHPITGRDLVAWVEASALRQADETTRRTVMHMIGQAIRWAREKRGLPPYDDPLPGDPESAWQVVHGMLKSKCL